MHSVYCHDIYNLLNLYRTKERINLGIVVINGSCNGIQDNCSAHAICLLYRRAAEIVVCSLTMWTFPTKESRAVLQQFVLLLVASTFSATAQFQTSDSVVHFD